MRILIVDSDPPCVLAMAQFFATRGYDPDVAVNVQEAKALLSRNYFDAVITDVRLTDGGEPDGLTILDHLRTSGLDTRAVVVTAYDGNDIHDEALRRGAQCFFVKPISLERLASVLDRSVSEAAASGQRGRR